MSTTARGIRAAQAGLLLNAGLVVLKLVAGLVGNSAALVADAIESSTDVFSSLIVWRALKITDRPADDEYPYGYGKAESIGAAAVALMLLGAALGIVVVAVREILTPHHTPAPFTLAVLVGVIVSKELLFRRVVKVGHEMGSIAVQADAWHHRSDALTSAAAFIGISVAIWGGPGWEPADDWAAMVAAVIIAINGLRLLRPAVQDLMDRVPEPAAIEAITSAAQNVAGVQAIEKLRVRRLGLRYVVDLHVQTDPTMILREAHILSGKVKGAIRSAVPTVAEVLVHMEPYEDPPPA